VLRIFTLHCVSLCISRVCSAGSCDSISVSGDENLEPDICALYAGFAGEDWGPRDWADHGGGMFEDLFGCGKKAREDED
jgi:hypothetical protein